MNNKLSRLIIIYICILLCITGAFFLYKSSKHNSMLSAGSTASAEQTVSTINSIETKEPDFGNEQNEDESEVYIPRFYVRGFFEIKEFLDEKKEEGMINEYSYNDGDYSAYVKVTEKQKQKWLKYSQSEIDKILDKDFDGFTMSVGEDNTSFHMDVQSDSDYYLATYTMQDVLFNIQNYLVFSGVKDWNCHVVIRNIDSGKNIMDIQYPNEEGTINNCDWTNIEDPVLAYETMISNCYSYIHYEEPLIEDGVYHSKAAGISIIIPDGAKVSTQEEMDEINGLGVLEEHSNRLYEIKKVILSSTPYEEIRLELEDGASFGVAVGYPPKDSESEFLDWMDENLEVTLKTESGVKEYNLSRVKLLDRDCLLQKRTDDYGKRYQYYYFKDGLYISILAKYETPEQEATILDFIENNIRSEE